jgi:hypothetical protein
MLNAGSWWELCLFFTAGEPAGLEAFNITPHGMIGPGPTVKVKKANHSDPPNQPSGGRAGSCALPSRPLLVSSPFGLILRTGVEGGQSPNGGKDETRGECIGGWLRVLEK